MTPTGTGQQFLAAHLEILYDDDIGAREMPSFIRALAIVVQETV